MGGTEGWCAVGDAAGGIAVIGDRSVAGAVPLLSFVEVEGLQPQARSFFLRIEHSAAETDETKASFFRGIRRFVFAVQGYRELDGVRRSALALERGLAVRTERDVGIAASL